MEYFDIHSIGERELIQSKYFLKREIWYEIISNSYFNSKFSLFLFLFSVQRCKLDESSQSKEIL
jgi:hypothetical protein